MDLNEIYEYCEQRYVHLCSEKDYDKCPFRETYKDRYFCTVSSFLVDYYVGGQYQEEINHFLEQACDYVRQELLEQQKIFKEAKSRKENLLNNAIVGDTVFCIPKCDNVILLEKSVDFSGRCRCKTLEGEELLVFTDDLNPLFDGNVSVIQKFKHVNDMYEFKARKEGFRIEKELLNDGVLYKVFGNAQDKIKDFIEDFIKNNEKKKVF